MHIQTVDFTSPKAPAIFTQSLKETGFGVLTNHPIDHHLVENAYAAWEAFFRADEATQAPYLFNPSTHDGFVPFAQSETAKGFTEPDLKAFYHYFPWGRCPDHLKTLTHSLYDNMKNVASTCLQWIEANTPEEIRQQFSIPLPQMIQDSNHSLLRPIYYPPLTGDEAEGAVRAAAHEDINLLTVLPAATAKGLQVKDSNGQWLDVSCDPGNLIVNIGDMLHECSNGYFVSTTHQVTNPEGPQAHTARLSIPLFLHPRDEVVLSKRHTAQSYREERFKELGLMG